MEGYKGTGLWKRTLGRSDFSNSPEALSVLAGSYNIFRERAAALTAQISKSLPNLTIHDVTHLDALWETADLIAGDNYPLSPAEAFVFGGAALLHDAALCFEAYEGGKEGLRDTVEWKDAFSTIELRSEHRGSDQNYNEADFAAMRLLHASRAADLAKSSWKTPEGEELFLIESYELRKHYGDIIGKIAASHHWSIEDVSSKLPHQINALASMPREWRVDPVKIACLLRCADAAHIDSRRAPDFLRALASLHGTSAHHWTAQNWLQRVDIDTSDPTHESLIYTSGRPFDEDNAEAWWVAFDTIQLIDKELSSSAELLLNRQQSDASPPFQARRVTGANSPMVASKSISTLGWKPQAVEIHVGNLEQLISQIGGTKLYGEDQSLIITIRELIQNARDSIIARRSIDSEHTGKIKVKIGFEDSRHTVSIEDDGIGMSNRVITGPLLDFGSSFWASDLARKEFPGLASSGYKPIGKFGIGFYSVFMISSAVVVSSRRFDAGLDRVTQVRFRNGLSLRPIIGSGPPPNFGSNTSTCVKLTLKPETESPSSVLISRGRPGYEPDVRMPIDQCLAFICAGLDVKVELETCDGTIKVVHYPIHEIDTPDKRREWLFGINGESSAPEVKDILEEHASRLRPITRDGLILGLAALSIAPPTNHREFSTITTVGGLSTNIGHSDLSRYIGSIDYFSNSAKRDSTGHPTAGQEALEKWAREQVTLLPQREVNPLAWCLATYRISDLQCDPIDIATVTVRKDDGISIVSLDGLLDIIKSEGLALYQSPHMKHVDTYHSQGPFNGMATFWPITNSNFLSLNRIGEEGAVHGSLISCIERRATERSISLSFQYILNAARSQFGVMPVLIIRSPADELAAAVRGE